MRFLLLAALYVGLTSYAVTDVLNRGQRVIYGLQRGMWITIIVLAPYIGALVWLGLKMRGNGNASRRSGPKPPDDDPEYLLWLREQQRRRRES